MDYYAAYSPYAMLLIASAIACVMVGAFLCAYGFAKIGKSFSFWMVIAALISLLCLPVAGFMALVSPSPELRAIYQDLRLFISMFAIFPLLCVLFRMRRRECGIKQCSIFGLVFLVHIICILHLWVKKSDVLADYLPMIDFAGFSIFLVVMGPSLFAELSPVSIDNFMQELGDIILIFDKSGRLIDANRQAKTLWPFLRDGLPIREFRESLKAITVSKKLVEKTDKMQYEEVAFSFPDGIRHYQCGETQVTDKRGRFQATVLNFHEVTEQSLLEKELANKNDELEDLNIKLKAYLDTAEILMEEEQKAKAANDIKEAVGIKIEKLLSELETVSYGDKKERLPELIEYCREAMAGVRLAMQKLTPDGRRDDGDD